MFPGSLHNHTDFSNLKGRDSINHVDELMDYAIELGHSVIAYTEHDCVSNVIKIQKKYKQIKEKNPNFKVVLGNEIYLVRNDLTSENFDKDKDKFFHFILLAKNAEGHKQIRELSTRAWMRSYMFKGMRRVPTYYRDLEDIISLNQGNVIASTSCIGGFCGQEILKYKETDEQQYLKNVSMWCEYIQNIFGKENFYLELQPSATEEQEYVNRALLVLAEQKGYKYIITTDSHYLKKEDAPAHKYYLRSQNIEREVESFYSTCYMMDTNELESYLKYMSQSQLEKAYLTIQAIADQCEDYDLTKPLKIPKLIWKKPQKDTNIDVKKYFQLIPNLKTFANSDFEGDNLLAELIMENIDKNKTLQNQDVYIEVNEELNTVWISSEVNKTHWSSYFLNLQTIIDTCWEAGSIVLPGRGSGVGFLLLYILGITQINPLREKTKTYAWRFLNPERVSVLDVDFDISGLRRETVLNAFREKYGQNRVSNVATFAVEKSKSAVLTAARGLNIDNDIAQYIASLIPSDRGIIRTLKQCYFGDKENGYKPIAQFIQEMNNYPELWEVAQKIEGTISRTGIHAGGIIFVDEDFTESTALMRAPDGTVITQFDLWDAEEVSLIKYDALSVEAADRIQTCLELLVNHNLVEDKGNLRDTYESVLGIYKIERDEPKMWEMVWNHEIQSLFQMEQQSGIQGIEATHPQSVDDLATLNSVIRLMAQEKGGELPLNKYARFKENINLWYEEMDTYNVSKDKQEILKNILGISYGICESQERFMTLVQLPECGGHSLTWADSLRKAIAKKNPASFNKLQKEFFKTAKAKNLDMDFCNYVWNVLIVTSKGYGFNLSHTLAYSLVALQEMNLAYYYPIIYWNCANLIVDSGGIEEIEQYDEEGKAKTVSTNYKKIAKGVCNMRYKGIDISCIDINKSSSVFEPDEERNTILYGLKAVNGLGAEVVQQIIENRPYLNFEDFMESTNFNKTVMVNLIKAGAFDEFGERKDIMEQYIWSVCEAKKRITMQNFNGLMERKLLPQDLNFQKRVFIFNKALKKNCKIGTNLKVENNYYDFYKEFFDLDLLVPEKGTLVIGNKEWKKQYDKAMLPAKEWITANKHELLEQLNQSLFQEMWNKYAAGDYSAWEMSSLGFYYHEHELAHINCNLYNIVSFNKLPEDPLVAYTFKRNKREIPIFETMRICGTVIAKEDMKSTVSILTPDSGVVDVKFSRDYYAMYNKRISQIQPDGSKKVMEQGWFQKGTLLIINGFRRQNQFVEKTYKKTPSHGIYKISKIEANGKIQMTHLRWGDEEDESV